MWPAIHSAFHRGHIFLGTHMEHLSSSWPGFLSRPSTSSLSRALQDVDARDKPGHDADGVPFAGEHFLVARYPCPCSANPSPNVFDKSFTCSGERCRGLSPRSSR
jgi:hypothetical protein